MQRKFTYTQSAQRKTTSTRKANAVGKYSITQIHNNNISQKLKYMHFASMKGST